MTNVLRVVVDTNVLVSGLFGFHNAPSALILNAIRNQKLILVTSPAIIEEVNDVLNRERIAKLFKLTETERKEIIDGLVARSDVTVGKQLTQAVSRDQKDDKFLACAIEGKADYLITGDPDLLDLGAYEGLPIVSPREFVELKRV
jgi:putative PIN family toxin of toxin-antitoxin system